MKDLTEMSNMPPRSKSSKQKQKTKITNEYKQIPLAERSIRIHCFRITGIYTHPFALLKLYSTI